ncbi:hypothetical protein BB561_001492 [Smittium simulii]|uniref:AMP-dependent synthetase/ligase domain-containing protein n=1 Tax=Smittium simulii TaxID=133385 RepID=A0A2T9YUC7_9FUNG|nr:hypothetical protein BB561_001492 [Smittium simulii]
MKAHVIPTQKKGESYVLRNHETSQNLELTLLPEVQTAYDMFWNSAKIAPTSPFVGHRPYNPVTKTFGPYVFQTYEQVAERLTNLGAGIIRINQKALGQPEGPFARQFPVCIYSINRPEWAITERACFTQSLYTVSLYDTLGESSVEYILNHCESPIIFCSLDKISKLLSLADKLPLVRVIVSIDSFGEDQNKPDIPSPFNTNSVSVLKSWANSANIALYDIHQVELIGKKAPIPHCPPKPTDTYTICYTSGTTGNPKGALSTHESYTFVAKSIYQSTQLSTPPIMMSYLPLAHCYDRTVENYTTLCQGSIGYFTGDITRLVDDIQTLQPTLFPSVPRLLNRIYDRMVSATINAPGLTGIMARRATETKLNNLKAGKGNLHFLWDRLLFKKLQAVISKRLEFVITGSAPLDPKVLDFLRIALLCKFVEGFGMTETAGVSSVQTMNEFTSGNVGIPNPGVELKLIDVPEMNYYATDKPNPRGELCIRGLNLFKEYIKDEEKTRESFTEDGWFMTGDIAKFNDDGTTSIIDRKKNIFKLSQGEYIAPEKIENVLGKNSLVMQTFVYGDSLKNHLIGIVVPDPETFIPWASKLVNANPSQASLDDLTQNPIVVKEFLKQLDKTAAADKLQGFEKIKALYLETTPFDIETNSLLTPTMKLKRNESSITENFYFYTNILLQPRHVMAISTSNVFSLLGKGLKLTTAEDIKVYIEQINNIESLEKIILSGNTIGSEASAELAKILPEKIALKSVDFSDIFTGRLREDVKESVQVLCDALLDLPNLQTLNLSDNAFGPTGAESMYNFLASNRALKELYLNNNGLGIQGAKLIAAAFMERHTKHLNNVDGPSLEVLVMGRNRLENGSSEEISEMFSRLGSLKVVRLPQNGIRPEGISTILKGLSKNYNLEHLDLQDNTFVLPGSKALAEALPNWKKLTALNIGDCLLGKQGGALAIESLKHNLGLVELNLQYNEIEEDGALVLSSVLCNLDNLKVLELNGNKFNAESEAVESIRNALISNVNVLENDEDHGQTSKESQSNTSAFQQTNTTVQTSLNDSQTDKNLEPIIPKAGSPNTNVKDDLLSESRPSTPRKSSAADQLNSDIASLVDEMKNNLKL